VLRPGDVAVIISSGGRLPELLAVADLARQRGAAVVAITASQSPLARKADAVLAVDHVEDSATQVPMISRILQLLVIDMLTVGVALRRPGADLPVQPEAEQAGLPRGPPAQAPHADSAAAAAPPSGSPAAAGALPVLARMTLHSR